ncbi:MAG TPA: GTP-binding protein, partial [Desulfosporosinus sp.]|nr:GTP-binding protein [Desulfosporosinus sp.]
MKIKIISGFLGAGKTTCVKNVLKTADGEMAVLVNEFGDIGIDAELITRGDIVEMVELPSGCICCTLQNDLVAAVIEIKTKFNPKRLIIEPSGLAVPSGVLEALEPIKEKYGLEFEAIIGIVDADGFLANVHSGLFGDFYTDQLANSDII